MAIWDKKTNERTDVESFLADSAKCPNCSSNLVFDSGHRACICRNCGGVFDVDSLSKLGSFSFAGLEKDYDGTIEVRAEDEARVEIVCNSCGAQIITDKNTSSTFCAFCGSPALVSRRLSREFKPDYIIPFKFNKAKAIEIFKEHCEGVDHLPKDIFSDEALSKMTGLYVPTWIISAEVEACISGMGRKGKMVDTIYAENHSESEGNYSFPVSGRVKFRLKNVPFDGEKNIPDRLMAAAEPFDFSELCEFRAEYLQGFSAEKYDQLPVDMTDAIYRRLDTYTLSICRKMTFGYDVFEPDFLTSTTKYINQDVKYALLPVWFLNVEYEGLRYKYIVNGQTGKVSGEFPYSKGWDKLEQYGRSAKVRLIDRNKALRAFLYFVPLIVISLLLTIANTIPGLYYMTEHPTEFLIIAITIGLAAYLCSSILPKVLHQKQKKTMESFTAKNSHELAPEPGAETYYDSSYPVTAVETNGMYIPLDSGWKYAEQKHYVPNTIMHDIEDDKIDEDATDFEKQGYNRRIWS